jgi:tetratricopeptide (TPR) repeat protein
VPRFPSPLSSTTDLITPFTNTHFSSLSFCSSPNNTPACSIIGLLYAIEYSLVSVYYRLATNYFNNKRYAKAKEYYEKAYEELNIYQTYFAKSLKHTVQLGIANSLVASFCKYSSTSTCHHFLIIDDKAFFIINLYCLL